MQYIVPEIPQPFNILEFMIDWDKFNDYLGSFETSFIIELIDMFIGNYPQQIETLRKNVEEKDFPQIDINAHSMKTNCASFGDMQSAKFAFNLELMGKNRVISNEELVNSASWTHLEKYGSSNAGDSIHEVFAHFKNATENLIGELEQYRVKQS